MTVAHVVAGEDFLFTASPAEGQELRHAGARWDARRKAWTLPATRMNALVVNDLALGLPDLSVALAVPQGELGDARLYPYQRSAAYRMARSRHGVIAVITPGLGKTAIAITAADDAVPSDQVVVVAPASLLRTWEREIARWATVPGSVYVVGGKIDIEEATAARWIIISWDKMARDPGIWGRGWPLFILDESVLTKSRASKRFKTLQKVRKGVARFWLLSGSPTTKHADDLWAQLHLAWPRAFPSYWRFAERYTVIEETPWARRVSADRSGRDAAEDNSDMILVVNQRDVIELPEYLFEPPLAVALSGAQARAYDDMRDSFYADLEGGLQVIAANEIGRLMKLQQIASWWDGKSAKHDAILEAIRRYEPPYLFWTHWREGATELAARLQDAGISTDLVLGGLDSRERDARIEGFKRGESDALVLSLGVGKFGHTLTNVRTIFSVDRTFNADDFFQSMHRVRRIGLAHQPVVVPVVATGTVDELTVGDNLEAKLRGIAKMTHSDLADLLRGIGR